MTTSLAARLAHRDLPPLILDGGLASELERQGADVSGDLWSAAVLAGQPDAVRAVHAAYFAAGAEVATSASYQATYAGFAAAGVGAAEASRLLRRSVELADAARADAAELDEAAGRAPRQRWVAASVGPYGAMLADGSEYRGDYGLSVRELRAFHRPRLQVLAQACADIGQAVLAVETLPSSAEVEAVVAELADLGDLGALGTGLEAWVSVTPDGGRTRTGEPVADALAIAAGEPGVVAVGVNCCEPDEVELALGAPDGSAKTVSPTGTPLLAYPNTGEVWDADARRWTGPATLDPARAQAWSRAGARALGGCCRVGPALLGQLARAVR